MKEASGCSIMAGACGSSCGLWRLKSSTLLSSSNNLAETVQRLKSLSNSFFLIAAYISSAQIHAVSWATASFHHTK